MGQGIVKESRANGRSMRSQLKSVSVHVHYKIARGGYLGTHELWTLMLKHPILTDVARSVIAYYIAKTIDTIARKAHGLLKKAKTEGKRVDIIIPIEDRILVIARIIGYPPLGTLFEGIPRVDEVSQALTYAMRELQKVYKKDPEMFLILEAMVRKREAQMSVQIRTNLDSELGAGLEQQIAEVRSEKPVSLRLNKPVLKRQQRGRKRKAQRRRR